MVSCDKNWWLLTPSNGELHHKWQVTTPIFFNTSLTCYPGEKRTMAPVSPPHVPTPVLYCSLDLYTHQYTDVRLFFTSLHFSDI